MIEIRRATLPEGQPPAAPVMRILEALDTHAAGHGMSFESEEIVMEAWDGETWAGGIDAIFGKAWVFVKLLAVADGRRGQGVGTKLLAAVEEEARTRGLTGIWLDTFAFQAPAFYRREGFEEIGSIPEYFAGQSRHFFQKRL
ncbi:GNAT family N-acetyltransferase [Pseudoroseicyclus tamaricis]|uniref:GNAT family N-acetyltransferase n=1 Tax=Pseudoroseicyclus tamaricis TaxID=2705421 RepID=A0A6B2JSF4_9RHOB|nr:GNAT family N-acetyltransferase [Pseudoroseicyclus tamaricis]NDV00930.1 GNAT family N-acetyltransferase [Pseudoroseicyclus tamaricis]